MNLITLDEALTGLFIDFATPATKADVELKIAAASTAVLTYLRKRTAAYCVVEDDYGVVLDSQGDPIILLDSQGDPVVRADVKLATLYLVGIFFRDRDGADAKIWQPGYLPAPITALLYPLRTPALA